MSAASLFSHLSEAASVGTVPKSTMSHSLVLSDIFIQIKSLKSHVSSLVSFSHGVSPRAGLHFSSDSDSASSSSSASDSSSSFALLSRDQLISMFQKRAAPRLHPINLFARPLSFYSFSLECEDISSTETLVSILKPECLAPSAYQILPCLFKILQSELPNTQLIGLRICYLSSEHADFYRERSTYVPPADTAVPVIASMSHSSQLSKYLDLLGPLDPVLARQSNDSSSLRARFGINREKNLIHVPQMIDWHHRDLCWFLGGRILPGADSSLTTQSHFVVYNK